MSKGGSSWVDYVIVDYSAYHFVRNGWVGVLVAKGSRKYEKGDRLQVREYDIISGNETGAQCIVNVIRCDEGVNKYTGETVTRVYYHRTADLSSLSII